MQLLAGIHQSELWQQLATQCQLAVVTGLTDELNAEHPPALLQSCISPTELQLLLQKQTLQQKQPQIALCFDPPEYIIARLLQQGSNVTEALASWQQQTTALLQLQQQYRRQLQLLQTDALLQNPAAAPDWLANALQPAAAPFVTSSSDIYVLLAAQALRQDLQAYQLWQRLIACSLPLTEQTSLVIDLQGLQQQLTDTSKADALQSQLSASNDERDLLLQQLLHVQEELEQLFQKKQTVKQQYSQLEQDYRSEVAELTAKLQNGEQTVEKTAEQLHKFQDELTRITAAHNQTQQQLTASNDERDLLLQQLLHVQEELEQLFQKKQTVKQQYSQLEQDYRSEVAQLSTKLQHGEQTVNKTAAQLHKLQDELSRITDAHNQTQQQLTASNDERDLLLQQLLHVQEELEQLFQKKQTVKQQYSQLEQDYRSEVVELSTKLQNGEQTVNKTAAQLQKLQGELKRLTDAHNHAQAAAATSEQLRLAAEQQQAEQASQLAEASKQLTASNDERDLLLQQLMHVQEELEQYYLKYQQLAKNSQQLSLVEKRWQGKLDAKLRLIAAKDEKLRSLSGKLKAARAETEQIQTELTARLQITAMLGARIEQVEQQLSAERDIAHKQVITLQKQSERSQAKLEQQLKVAIAEAARARQQAAMSDHELAAVKSSTLWKSAAPVRKLASVLSKSERDRQRVQQEAALIYTSEYFDLDWYLQSYPDVAESGINPAEHYLRFGATEGRYPGPLFDGNWYLQRYPDVAEAGLNPLLHFIKFGQPEGRTASPKLLADSSTQNVAAEQSTLKQPAKRSTGKARAK